MPLNTPDNSVGGPWGATPYPPWFEQYVHPGATIREKANQFVTWIRRHPEQTDLGEYWNQFREGGRYYGADQPFTTGSADPQPEEEPEDPNNNAPQPDPPRPTAPGGQTPGRWAKHVSTVNGVRRARWRWHVDPVAPAPPAAPPPAGPPVGDPPEQEPPGHNPPQPPTPQPPANDNQGGWTQGGQGGGMYNGGGGGMGMAGNSMAGGQTSGARMIAPQGPGPTKPPPKPGPFPNPMPPTVPPNSTAAPSTDPALNQVKNSFTGNPAYGKKKPAYNSGYNPNLGN